MATWWKNAVGYAIFPLSFQDSNGDGLGDIQGIIDRLDYLRWLGVDLIWLGPLYRSPMVDAGYDIADFEAIDRVFGTLEDFDRLVEEMHRLGMRLVMDFVPNHTSDQHPWFMESRQSRSSAKRDWYLWHDGKPDGGPPNNWIDNTKQTAWTWDPSTEQWYYHLFLNCQPDLNLRNRSVVQAIETGMRFWLDRGVDGFRLDSAMNLFEDGKRTNGTTCPSEIARVLAKEGCAAEAWRDYIWPVRCLMGLLTTQGRVGLSRKSVSLLGRSGHYKLGKSRT